MRQLGHPQNRGPVPALHEGAYPVKWLNLDIAEVKLYRFRLLIVSSEEGTEWGNRIFPKSDVMSGFFIEHDPKQPMIISDVKSPEVSVSVLNSLPDDFEWLGDKTGSGFILYLMVEGKLVGYLALECLGANRYIQKHADLLAPLQEPLALILTTALVTGRLYDRRRFWLKKMSYCARKPASSVIMSLETILV